MLNRNLRRFPSAKVAGMRKRLQKERQETIPAKKGLLKAALEAVKIIMGKDHEGEIPSLEQVLAGEVKARLMVNGRFASKVTVQATIDGHNKSIAESNEVVSDIRSKLKKMGVL